MNNFGIEYYERAVTDAEKHGAKYIQIPVDVLKVLVETAKYQQETNKLLRALMENMRC